MAEIESCGCQSEPHTCEDPAIAELERQLAAARASADGWRLVAEAEAEERRRLTALLNMPRTDEWFEAVRIEAAHQIDRWGVEHDAGKRPEDWLALLVYLLGKATKAHYERDREKLLHHIISTSAALLNWHRALVGDSNAMRPGIGPEVPRGR